MKLRKFIYGGTRSVKLLVVGMASDGKHTELKKSFSDITFATWSELKVEDGTLTVRGEPVAKFQFILIGPVGKNIDMHTCLQAVIQARKLGSFSYGTPTELNNKPLQAVKMKLAGVAQVKTIIAVSKEISAGTLIRELKLPIVSKITDGSKGKGVEKHDDKVSLEKLLKKDPDKTYIFQEFIPNDGDYRIFYVKDRVIYYLSRKSSSEGEFRNNVSLGGKFEYLADLDPAAKVLANDANRCMGFDVTGVDLIQHKDTKEWYVMEINAAPQFDGEEVSSVIDAICNFIR
jgi:hypothetical protein